MGQAGLFSTPMKGLQFGWTYTVFHPMWTVFPDLHTCRLHYIHDHESHDLNHRDNK